MTPIRDWSDAGFLSLAGVLCGGVRRAHPDFATPKVCTWRVCPRRARRLQNFAMQLLQCKACLLTRALCARGR